MHSIAIAGIIFAFAFGGVIVGLGLRSVLPQSHLDKQSQRVIKLGGGLIASMAALVLGLLVASATAAFDVQRTGFQQLAANVVLLDRTLAQYGPETQPAREALRRAATDILEHLWPTKGQESTGLAAPELTTRSGEVFVLIRDLVPANDAQRAIQSQAIEISVELARTRWQLSQRDDDSIPRPFLVVLAFWLCALFVSFGLFAPRNATVIASLFVCAISVAGAVFLIVDLDQPFDGLIQVSGAPLRSAVSQLGQ